MNECLNTHSSIFENMPNQNRKELLRRADIEENGFWDEQQVSLGCVEKNNFRIVGQKSTHYVFLGYLRKYSAEQICVPNYLDFTGDFSQGSPTFK